jgi:hypothetical protein
MKKGDDSENILENTRRSWLVGKESCHDVNMEALIGTKLV